jgi:hypothetical protein
VQVIPTDSEEQAALAAQAAQTTQAAQTVQVAQKRSGVLPDHLRRDALQRRFDALVTECAEQMTAKLINEIETHWIMLLSNDSIIVQYSIFDSIEQLAKSSSSRVVIQAALRQIQFEDYNVTGENDFIKIWKKA